jgi:YegS/Rv2252/BmrU family lipid kinase
MNPVARSGKARKQCEKILSLLKKRNIDFEFKWTQRPYDATGLASLAVKRKFPTVVAVGGDGTICEVITGLFSNNEKGIKPKLGVLHIGTSPDFNKYHQIPVELEAAIRVLLQGRSRLIDIGKIRYCSEPEGKNEITSYFASNVNVGLGPQIAKKANSRYRRYLGDFLGTLTATLISLAGFKKMKLNISIDDKQQEFNKLINLTVGKDPYLASGMRIFSQIEPDNGKMYILSIEQTSWMAVLSNIPKLYRGNFLDYAGARINYAKEIEIDYSAQYPLIEFDGDVKGYLPAKIEVLPQALEIIVA